MLLLPLLVPGHLNRFEFLFVRLLRLPGEPLEFHHPAVQVSEAHGERIDIWVSFQEPDGDLFGVGPIHFGHCSPTLNSVNRKGFKPQLAATFVVAVSPPAPSSIITQLEEIVERATRERSRASATRSQTRPCPWETPADHRKSWTQPS